MWIDFVAAVIPALLAGLTTGLMAGHRIGSGSTILIVAALFAVSLSDWTPALWFIQLYPYPVVGPFAAGLVIGKVARWFRTSGGA